jgi:CheY-like chemotaxis protein
VRHPRRRDAVWLVTGAAPNRILNGQSHHTAGALALNNAHDEQAVGSVARRCALIVERDPALAEALTHALQARFEPVWSVRRVGDSRLIAPASQSNGPEIIVLDASWPVDGGGDNYTRLSAHFEVDDAQLIFVTSDTSYQLSQRGIMSGVVLREWLHPDDIVTLVTEALADDDASA